MSSGGRWASRTVLPTPLSLLIDDRGHEATAVEDWLHGEPLAVSVIAPSQEEALAFRERVLARAPGDERQPVVGRTLVVRTKPASNSILARSSGPMILVPTFNKPETAAAVGMGVGRLLAIRTTAVV